MSDSDIEVSDHDFSAIDESTLVWPETVPQYSDLTSSFKETLLFPVVAKKVGSEAVTDDLMQKAYEEEVKYLLKYQVRYASWYTSAAIPPEDREYAMRRSFFEYDGGKSLATLSAEDVVEILDVVREEVCDVIEQITEALSSQEALAAYLFHSMIRTSSYEAEKASIS